MTPEKSPVPSGSHSGTPESQHRTVKFVLTDIPLPVWRSVWCFLCLEEEGAVSVFGGVCGAFSLSGVCGALCLEEEGALSVFGGVWGPLSVFGRVCSSRSLWCVLKSVWCSLCVWWSVWFSFSVWCVGWSVMLSVCGVVECVWCSLLGEGPHAATRLA